MTYVLMLCVFMSSSGESCDDVGQYKTMEACQAEAAKHSSTGFEKYRCEVRSARSGRR